MNREDFSFNTTISKNGQIYKNFYLPVATNDIIFSDLFEGHIAANYDNRATTDSITTPVTVSPFSITVNVPPMGIGETVVMREFPTLYPKLKTE